VFSAASDVLMPTVDALPLMHGCC